MSRVTQREDLFVGAIIEATANPSKGKQYRICEVRPKSWHNSFIYYFGSSINTERVEFRGHLTLNHIRRYFKLVQPASAPTGHTTTEEGGSDAR